jgi:phosphorylase kinase alpha/beta subunit
MRLNWLEKHDDRVSQYDQDKAIAWQKFYETSPYVCASYIVKAFRFLAQGEVNAA